MSARRGVTFLILGAALFLVGLALGGSALPYLVQARGEPGVLAGLLVGGALAAAAGLALAVAGGLALVAASEAAHRQAAEARAVPVRTEEPPSPRVMRLAPPREP